MYMYDYYLKNNSRKISTSLLRYLKFPLSIINSSNIILVTSGYGFDFSIKEVDNGIA